MATPDTLRYTETHEWASLEGDVALVGLTDHAQSELGDLVFVNLPEEGDDVAAGEAFGDVESVKAVSEVISPVSGTVAAVNEEVLDNPALINEAPYDAWLIKVEGVSADEIDDLMDAAAYEASIA